MSEYWPFVIIGLTTGSIYGLAAIGLVLTYRTSGIFNFAHGSIATVSALLFFLMFEAHAWPWWLAMLDAGAHAATKRRARQAIADAVRAAVDSEYPAG